MSLDCFTLHVRQQRAAGAAAGAAEGAGRKDTKDNLSPSTARTPAQITQCPSLA